MNRVFGLCARAFFEIALKHALERWPSGRRRTIGNRVYGNVSRVRIPLSPPSVFANSALAKFSYDAIVLLFYEIEAYKCVGACEADAAPKQRIEA